MLGTCPRIVRLILDGTGVKARLDGRCCQSRCWSCFAAGRPEGSVRGQEHGTADRGSLAPVRPSRPWPEGPELLIVDGGKGLEAALASLWSDIPVQRCTVRKERNLLARRRRRMHDEVKAAPPAMMGRFEDAELLAHRSARPSWKWRLRCRGVDSLERGVWIGKVHLTALSAEDGSSCGPPTPSNDCTANSSAG